jgi:hypothetical protein
VLREALLYSSRKQSADETMNIHVRFLAISVGILTSGAMMGVAGCGSSSSGGLGPTDSGSSSSSTSTGGSTSTSSSPTTADAGDAGQADAADGGSDSGSDAASHDSSTEAADSGSDAGEDASVGDGAANVLLCLTVTCELPNQFCCPGFDVDGGNECLTANQCLASAYSPDLYECTGSVNCPDGGVCCVVFGGTNDGQSDLATCMSQTDCAAQDNSQTGAVVCEEDADCAFLMNMEGCQAGGGAALPTCQ